MDWMTILLIAAGIVIVALGAVIWFLVSAFSGLSALAGIGAGF